MSNTTRANKAALKSATILTGATGADPVSTETSGKVTAVHDAARNDTTILPLAATLATYDAGEKLIVSGKDKVSCGRQLLSYAIVSYYLTQRAWDETTALNVGRSPKDTSQFRADNVSLFVLRQSSRPSQNYKGMTPLQELAAKMTYEEFHTLELRCNAASNLALTIIAAGITQADWNEQAKRWQPLAHKYCEHNVTPCGDASARYIMPTGASKKSSIKCVMDLGNGKTAEVYTKTDATNFMTACATRFRQAGDWLGNASLAKPIAERAPHPQNDMSKPKQDGDKPAQTGDGKVPATSDTPPVTPPVQPVAPSFAQNNQVPTPTPQLPTGAVPQVTITPERTVQVTPVSPAKMLENDLTSLKARLLFGVGCSATSMVDGLGFMTWSKFTSELTPDARKLLVEVRHILNVWNAKMAAGEKADTTATKGATDKNETKAA